VLINNLYVVVAITTLITGGEKEQEREAHECQALDKRPVGNQ
jgi:hypothetical protein